MLRLIFHLVQDHLPQHIPEKHHKSVFDSIDFYRNQRSTCSYCWQPWLMFQWWFRWQDLSAPWMRELRQQILEIHNCLRLLKKKNNGLRLVKKTMQWLLRPHCSKSLNYSITWELGQDADCKSGEDSLCDKKGVWNSLQRGLLFGCAPFHLSK